MRRFTGRFANKVDAKGRVSIPAPYRQILAAQAAGETTVYLGVNQRSGCIQAFTEAFMDKIADRIDALDIGSDERDAMEDEYFAATQLVQTDPEGRMIMPKDMVADAGIASAALFVGKGDRFEIWHPDAYQAHTAQLRERVPNRALKRVSGREAAE